MKTKYIATILVKFDIEVEGGTLVGMGIESKHIAANRYPSALDTKVLGIREKEEKE